MNVFISETCTGCLRYQRDCDGVSAKASNGDPDNSDLLVSDFMCWVNPIRPMILTGEGSGEPYDTVAD